MKWFSAIFDKGERHKRTRGEVIADTVRYVLLAVFASVFVGSLIFLIDNFAQKAQAKELYDEVAAEFAAAGLQFGFIPSDKTDKTPAEMTNELQKNRTDTTMRTLTESIRILESKGTIEVPADDAMHAELEKLRAVLDTYKERNEDVFGYISVPAVGIEYVVVQGEDYEFYLNHNYKKEPLVVGTIYMDYRCSENPAENYNTVLYGHNIETPGIMFHGVTDYYDKKIFENERIYLYTMDGVFVYKAFAVYDTRADSGYIRTSFETDEDFSAFLSDMHARTDVKNSIDLTGIRNIITLSTCTNYNNGRYALHAYLEEYIH